MSKLEDTVQSVTWFIAHAAAIAIAIAMTVAIAFMGFNLITHGVLCG